MQHWPGWRDGASWHQEWFDRLDQARKAGTTVPAWVNPEGPPKTVLDKELRWARLFLAIPLLVMFGGASVFTGRKFVQALFGVRSVLGLFGIRNLYGVRQTIHLVRHFFRKKSR